MGWLPNGIIGFGTFSGYSRILVPKPPQKSTTFMRRPPLDRGDRLCGRTDELAFPGLKLVRRHKSHQRGRCKAEDRLQPCPPSPAPRSGVAPVNPAAKPLEVDLLPVVTEFSSDGLDVAAKTR